METSHVRAGELLRPGVYSTSPPEPPKPRTPRAANRVVASASVCQQQLNDDRPLKRRQPSRLSSKVTETTALIPSSPSPSFLCCSLASSMLVLRPRRRQGTGAWLPGTTYPMRSTNLPPVPRPALLLQHYAIPRTHYPRLRRICVPSVIIPHLCLVGRLYW